MHIFIIVGERLSYFKLSYISYLSTYLLYIGPVFHSFYHFLKNFLARYARSIAFYPPLRNASIQCALPIPFVRIFYLFFGVISLSLTATFRNSLKTSIKCGRENWGKSAMAVGGDRRPCAYCGKLDMRGLLVWRHVHQHTCFIVSEWVYRIWRLYGHDCLQLRGHENSTYDHDCAETERRHWRSTVIAPPTYYNHTHIICIIIRHAAVSLASNRSLQVPIRSVSSSMAGWAIMSTMKLIA